MKIIVVGNITDIVSQGHAPEIILGADSALLRHGEPLFIDGAPEQWVSLIAPAVRIGRLGTHIPQKFADGYIDAHTLFHLRFPADDRQVDFALWGMSDRTFSPGEWLPGNFSGHETVRILIEKLRSDATCPPDETYTDSIGLNPYHTATAVAMLSGYSTLKTGDVLVFAGQGLRKELRQDTQLNAWLSDTQVLNFRIK